MSKDIIIEKPDFTQDQEAKAVAGALRIVEWLETRRHLFIGPLEAGYSLNIPPELYSSYKDAMHGFTGAVRYITNWLKQTRPLLNEGLCWELQYMDHGTQGIYASINIGSRKHVIQRSNV